MFAACFLGQNSGFSQVNPNNATTSRGLQLVARTAKTNYLAGERIVLDIVITNGSQHTFSYGSAMPTSGYKYRVVGLADKQNAPLTRIGHKWFFEAQNYHMEMVEIPPGQTYTNKAIVNQLFDVTIPQEYEITVSRQSLQSNPVRFSVQSW